MGNSPGVDDGTTPEGEHRFEDSSAESGDEELYALSDSPMALDDLAEAAVAQDSQSGQDDIAEDPLVVSIRNLLRPGSAESKPSPFVERPASRTFVKAAGSPSSEQALGRRGWFGTSDTESPGGPQSRPPREAEGRITPVSTLSLRGIGGGEPAPFIPDTVTKTPVETYPARSERAARVAAALEKITGGLRRSTPASVPIYNGRAENHVVDTPPRHWSALQACATDSAGNDSVSTRQTSLLSQSHVTPRSQSLFDTPSEHVSYPPLKDDIIPLVVESMHQYRTDPRVADRGLTALRRLTVRDSARDRIGHCGGIETVVLIMQYHSLRVRIQTQACLVLANLTFNHRQNKDRVLRARGFQAVVAAMSLHPKVEHIQAWGCLSLRNFSNCRHASTADSCLIAGAVDVLVTALEDCVNSRIVQIQAPIALGNIANNSETGSARIREIGGLQVIIASCRRNQASASVVDAILACLRALATQEANQRVIGRHGGIQAISDSMIRHKGHVGIIAKGCSSFRYLSYLKENRETIGSCGGIRSITLAMSHAVPVSDDVSESILRALSNSTYECLMNKTIAGREGAIPATLTMLAYANQSKSPRIAEDACRVLRNLADGVTANHALILQNCGLAAVLDAIREYGVLHEGLAEHALALFVNLGIDPSMTSQLKAGSGDIAEAAQRMALAHPDSPQVRLQANSLLHILDGPPRDGRFETRNRRFASRLASRVSAWPESVLPNHDSHSQTRANTIKPEPDACANSRRRVAKSAARVRLYR